MHDDFNGADFHAISTKGDIIKVQLKGRITIDEKYLKKDILIGFSNNSKWYLYPHDKVFKLITEHSDGAKKNAARSIGYIPKWLDPVMNQYKIS